MGSSVRAGLSSRPHSERGCGTSFQVPTISYKTSRCVRHPLFSRRSKTSSFSARTEEGDCTGQGPVIPRLLQPTVPSTKTDRRGQTCYRSVPVEPAARRPIIQDGDAGIGQRSYSTRRVGDDHRHKGCIPTCPNGYDNSEIPEIQGGVTGVPIPVFTVWPVDLTPRVHEAASAYRTTPQSARSSSPCLPRRLADTSQFTTASQARCVSGSQCATVTGLDSKPTQVLFQSIPRLRVSGHAIRDLIPFSEGSSLRRPQSQTVATAGQAGSQSRVDSQRVDLSFRSTTVPGTIGASGKNEAPAHSVDFQETLEPEHRFLAGQAGLVQVNSERSTMVDFGRSILRSTHSETRGFTDLVHRCIDHRLGCHREKPQCIRSVERSDCSAAHQLSGDPGSFTGSQSLTRCVSWQSCQIDDRQQNSCGIHQKCRRYSLQIPERSCCQGAQAGIEDEHYSTTSVHSRQQKCLCRCLVPQGSDPGVRVDSGPDCTRRCVPIVGSAMAGPVCHETQQTSQSVCLSIPGRTGIRCRCSGTQLEGSRSGICIPTTQEHSGSDPEILQLFGHSDDPDSPTEGLVVMDARTDANGSGQDQPGQTPSTTVPSSARAGKDISQVSRLFQTSRLATLEAIYTFKGFSSDLAELIAKPQRPSTVSLYQSRWESFLKWCKSVSKHPAKCSLSMFMEYLTHLFRSGLGPSAIKGHRSAVGPIFRSLEWFDPSKDCHLTLLMRRFCLDKPRTSHGIPRWDLGLVLTSFLKHPYVDSTSGADLSIDLKWLTVKTVFLVALATGRRVSCIRSLEYSFTVSRGSDPYQQVIKLTTLPEFRAKNQRHSDLAPEIVLPGMSHMVEREPERLLCPVRALRIYAKKTAKAHENCLRLFMNWVPGKAEITTGHISRWVMLAVRTAYEGSGVIPPTGIAAHELRALSASWAYRNHVALDDIKAALYWRSDGIFQDHYLRDMSSASEGMSRLGPVVAAGRVLRP